MPCSYSDKVEVDNNLVGNRVEIQSHLLPGADAQSGRVDYEILVPADASITLHSSTGPLRAERLHGDMTLEGAAATVDIRDITDAHVHVKTLNGPVTLTNVQDGHVEVDSLSGEVTLNGVTGPLVQVISTSGSINYTGDFGDQRRIPPDQPQRQHRSHRAGDHFRRRERALGARRSARRYSSPTQNPHLVRRQRRQCLLGYHGPGRRVIDRGAAQLQW